MHRSSVVAINLGGNAVSREFVLGSFVFRSWLVSSTVDRNSVLVVVNAAINNPSNQNGPYFVHCMYSTYRL